MRKTIALKFLFFLFCSLYLFGQSNPYAFTLNKISGLPSDMVFDVKQDRKGFIWLGTAKGIFRYDGVEVKSFTSVDVTVKSVSNINQDKKGRIWFQDFNGNIFFVEDNRIQSFKAYKANGFLKYALIHDKLYIAGKKGIRIYDISSFRLLKEIPLDLHTTIQTVALEDSFYTIGEEIHVVNPQNQLRKLTLPADYTKKITAPIITTDGKKLYVFSKFDPSYLVINNGENSLKTLPFNVVFTQNANVIDQDIWLCSTKGLYRFNPQNNTYKHYFAETNISFITKTAVGNFWISTLTNGALYVEDFNSGFIATPTIPIRLVNEQNNLLFSSNRDEIFSVDELFNVQRIYKGKTDHVISPLFVDRNNNRLLFASSKFIIKSQHATLEHIIAVKQIAQLDAKYYVISASTWNGIIYTDPKLKSEWDKEFGALKQHSQDGIYFIPLVTSENGKNCFVDTKDNSIYFLTNYGIRRYHKGITKDIPNDTKSVFIQMENLDGKIYLLSQNENLYELNSGKVHKIKLPNKFENAKIQKFKIIDDSIYLIKDNVVYNYLPQQQKIIPALHIPKDVEINDIAKFQHRLFFSTNKGIIHIPYTNTFGFQPLKLFVNNITANGKIIHNKDFDQLKSSQNNIEINFDIQSEAPNAQYEIYYKMDDSNWQKISNLNRRLVFSSISSGKHHVVLKIVRDSEVISKEISFYISPPFYLTWWFLALLGIALIFGIYFIFKTIIKRINLENSKKIEKLNLEKLVNQNKLKSLKSQMNPHFFFNALNTLQSYIVANEKKEAVFYLSKFSKLTRSILDMSDRDNISLKEEIETLKVYLDLEKARFDNDFQYNIFVDEQLENSDVTIPTLLIQPYVENAIKHGLLHKNANKNLEVTFDKFNDMLMIKIEDNGIGRKRSMELNAIKNKNHKSFATQSLEERIMLINHSEQYQINIQYIDKNDNRGTIVLLKIKSSDV